MLYRFITAAIPLIVALNLACAGIQTEPTCKVQQFGRVVVRNNTDDYKTVRIFRIIHDGERYKTVGPPIERIFEPMVEGRIRISPGMILIVVDKINGKTWMKPYIVKLCGTILVDMNAAVAFKDIPANTTEINSRRTCGICPPCPILPWPFAAKPH